MRVTFNGRDLTKLHTRLELLSDESKAKIRQHIHDTAVTLHGQRSETMETYSTIIAMAKAKAEPDTLFRNDEYDTTVVYHTTPFPRWVFTEPDKEWWYVRDMELQKEQPKVQAGDWFRDGAVYTKVVHVIDKDYVMAKDFNQAPHEPKDEYQEDKHYLRQLEQVTDKRKLLFLNAGRLPGQWKAGDIFQTTKRQPFRIAPKDVSSELMEAWGARPVCFVEDRKDRGEQP